jgi:hypothetical protein
MLVAGLLLLWLSSILLRGFIRANPAALSRIVRSGGATLALGVAVLMMIRGQFNVAFGAACLGFWLLGTQPRWTQGLFNIGSHFPGWRPRAAGQDPSRVRSEAVEMALDQATGRITGWFVAGPAAGRALDDLSRAESLGCYRWCMAADPQGARLLETYFDRRFPGWREAADFGEDAGRSQSGTRAGRAARMSDDEAYHLLGLAQGAGREEITRAHRRLMKKYHPDHGGSTDLAARVNEAKDVLMRRHP